MQVISRPSGAAHGATWLTIVASSPARFVAWLGHRRHVATAIRELSWHSDRELADLGVSRGDIVALAEGRSRHG